MNVTITTKGGCLHGKMRFKEGQTYSVTDDVGGFLVGIGWAEKAAADAKAEKVDPALLVASEPQRVGNTLAIDDVQLSTAAPAVGVKKG